MLTYTGDYNSFVRYEYKESFVESDEFHCDPGLTGHEDVVKVLKPAALDKRLSPLVCLLLTIRVGVRHLLTKDQHRNTL